MIPDCHRLCPHDFFFLTFSYLLKINGHIKIKIFKFLLLFSTTRWMHVCLYQLIFIFERILTKRMSSSPSADMEAFRKVFQQTRRVVILTGAGVSAESGVPTFRGAGGLWRTFNATTSTTQSTTTTEPTTTTTPVCCFKCTL